jgi:hypothetical protein
VKITHNLSFKFYPDFIPVYGYMVSGVRCQDSTPSYETTPKWHGLLMIKLAASVAWIKQRTAEFRRLESLRSAL